MRLAEFKDSFFQKKVIITLCIFLSVFLILGFSFPRWGIEMDDYGNLFGSQVHSWKDFAAFFCGKDLFLQYFPSNYVVHEQSFFNVYYRPLLNAFWALEYYFFGVHPQGYFITWMFLHALNAALFFNILCSFSQSVWCALWGALYFASHVSLGVWIGFISTPNYPICLLFMQLSLILFFYFFKQRRYLWLLLSLLAYAIVLFTYEIFIIFMVFVSSLCIIYPFLKKHYPYMPSNRYIYLLYSLGFWLVGLFFLGLRLFFFPLPASKQGLLASGLQLVYKLKAHFYMIASSCLAELGNLSFISPEHHRLKTMMFLLLVGACFWLWYKSSNRMVAVFLLGQTFLFMWPIIRFYESRYIYLPLILFISFILVVLRADEKDSVLAGRWRYLIALMGWLLIAFNTSVTMSRLAARERSSSIDYQAFTTLASNKTIQGKPLCFIGLPYRFLSSTAQGIWLYGVNQQLPIYYDVATFVWRDSSTEELNIIPIKKGYRCSFSTAGNSFLSLPANYFGGGSFSMGKRIENRSDAGLIDISYIFDNKFLKQGLLFIAWDFKTMHFVILPPPLE